MPLKVDPERTQLLKVPEFTLVNHWRLEQWAKDMKLGKSEAADRILGDFLEKNVILPFEQKRK